VIRMVSGEELTGTGACGEVSDIFFGERRGLATSLSPASQECQPDPPRALEMFDPCSLPAGWEVATSPLPASEACG